MNPLDQLKQFTTVVAVTGNFKPLAQLAPQAAEAPLPRRLDAAQARAASLPELHYDEASFRYAHNDDAMATEKLAEGIRAFAVDSAKLDALIERM